MCFSGALGGLHGKQGYACLCIRAKAHCNTLNCQCSNEFSSNICAVSYAAAKCGAGQVAWACMRLDTRRREVEGQGGGNRVSRTAGWPPTYGMREHVCKYMSMHGCSGFLAAVQQPMLLVVRRCARSA